MEHNAATEGKGMKGDLRVTISTVHLQEANAHIEIMNGNILPDGTMLAVLNQRVPMWLNASDVAAAIFDGAEG